MSNISPTFSGSIGCDSSPSFFLFHRRNSMIRPDKMARPAIVAPAMIPAFAPVDNPSSSFNLPAPVREDSESESIPAEVVSPGSLLVAVPVDRVDVVNEVGAGIRVETVIEILVAVAVALVGLAVPVKPAAE